MADDAPASNEQLTRLAQYFDEAVTFSKHIKSRVEDVEPGRAVCRIDVEEVHLNGNGTLHGGVYASLIDNAMGFSVAALVGLRTATIALDVHFLGAVREGPSAAPPRSSTAPAASPPSRRRSATPKGTSSRWARARSASSRRAGTRSFRFWGIGALCRTPEDGSAHSRERAGPAKSSATPGRSGDGQRPRNGPDLLRPLRKEAAPGHRARRPREASPPPHVLVR